MKWSHSHKQPKKTRIIEFLRVLFLLISFNKKKYIHPNTILNLVANKKADTPSQSLYPLKYHIEMIIDNSKIDKNIYGSINRENKSYSLDTLEVTSDYCLTENHKTQYGRAIRKYHQIAKLKQIIDVVSEDRKKIYWKTSDRDWETIIRSYF